MASKIIEAMENNGAMQPGETTGATGLSNDFCKQNNQAYDSRRKGLLAETPLLLF